jgi:hypothetical protein
VARRVAKDSGGRGAVSSSYGESLQFAFAPLQDADIFEQPFDAISVERRNYFPFDRVNGVWHWKGILDPVDRPLPGFLLEPEAQLHQTISDVFGFGELAGKLALDIFKLLGEARGHGMLQYFGVAIIFWVRMEKQPFIENRTCGNWSILWKM